MPLSITLKPNERLLVNGASIRNGERTVRFLVENRCRVLRESEILYESEADTPVKRLVFAVQVAYMCEPEHRTPFEAAVAERAAELAAAVPSMGADIAEILRLVGVGGHYKALKVGHGLFAYEAELLARAARDRAA